jgi:Na+/melibiose symporter-like transporter
MAIRDVTLDAHGFRLLYRLSRRHLTNLSPAVKKRRLFILMAVVIPLAVVIVVLDWEEGYLVGGGFRVVVSLLWTIVAMYLVWKLSRPQEKVKEKIPTLAEVRRHIRNRRFASIFCFIMLLLWVLSFISDTILGHPWYLFLTDLWWIIVLGSEFVFVTVFTNELFYKGK